MSVILQVENLDLHLGDKWLFTGLSFQVESGEFLSILGPNGAGKSTLLKVLLGTIPASGGRASYKPDANGVAANTTRLGYVPQSRQMDQDTPLNVWDFVSFGLPHHVRPWLSRHDRHQIAEALEMTKCAEYAYQSIGRLSGGQRQKAYLAQAIVRHPDLLLLDEPTSSLDPGAQETIVQLVNRICKDRKIGVLFVSHDLNLVARYTDRILYLSRGQYKIGSTNEMTSNTALSELYRLHRLSSGEGVEVI